MGLKKKQVPGCGCCGSTVPPPNNCCSGTIPSTMTLQIVMSGTATFQPMLDSIGVECEYACIDLQGTWVLSREAPDVCRWCASTQIAKVVGSCDEPYYDWYTVSFNLWYDFDSLLGVQMLKFWAIWHACNVIPGTSFDTATLMYAQVEPATSICADWTVPFGMTESPLYPCGGDFDSIAVSTP